MDADQLAEMIGLCVNAADSSRKQINCVQQNVESSIKQELDR